MPFFQAVPLLRVADVERSMLWYRDMLGFVGDPFPERSPYAFAILRQGEVELMLRRGAPTARRAAEAYDWDVYLRWEAGRKNRPTFRELYAMLCRRGIITRRLERMAYGLCEFEITDPDGYVLCLCAKLEDDRDLPTPEV